MGKGSKKGGKKATPNGTPSGAPSASTSPSSHSPELTANVEEPLTEEEPSAHANGGTSPPAKPRSKAPAPLPEAVKEQEAAREERSLEAVRRELAKTEAALAALRTEHEDLAAARAQLIRTVHRLEEEVAEERSAADDARAALSRTRLAAYGLGTTTALSLFALGVLAVRCLRRAS